MLAGDAVACTCAAAPARQRLDSADAAFIGRLIAQRPGGLEGEAAYLFSVDSVVKGELGRRVEVLSPTSGAACGFELRRDDASGILLRRDGSDWTGGLCGQIAVGELLEAAEQSDQPLLNWGGVVLGTIVLGVGGLLLARRLRRGRTAG